MCDLEIQNKIDAIELAAKLSNVTEAARLSGCWVSFLKAHPLEAVPASA